MMQATISNEKKKNLTLQIQGPLRTPKKKESSTSLSGLFFSFDSETL